MDTGQKEPIVRGNKRFESEYAMFVYKCNRQLVENLRQQSEMAKALHRSFDSIDWALLDVAQRQRFSALKDWARVMMENWKEFFDGFKKQEKEREKDIITRESEQKLMKDLIWFTEEGIELEDFEK